VPVAAMYIMVGGATPPQIFKSMVWIWILLIFFIHTVLKDGDRFPPETFKEQLLIGANVDQ
jgi:hypothetical protein